jgi:DNA polymerase III alpha subunit (gram-positive type)
MSQYYLAFDTETGGLDPKLADVLTLYMAMVDEEFKVIDEIDLKLKPNEGLPRADAGALRVNGINIQNHMADPATITYNEANVKVIEFFKKYLQKKGRYSNLRPFGQNVQFDIDFVQEHIVPKAEWDKYIHYGKVDTKQCVDFLKDAGWFPKDLGSLGSVVEYLGIPKRAAHNAKEDTLMTIDVYKKIMDIMKSKKENGSQQDLISLLEAE